MSFSLHALTERTPYRFRLLCSPRGVPGQVWLTTLGCGLATVKGIVPRKGLGVKVCEDAVAYVAGAGDTDSVAECSKFSHPSGYAMSQQTKSGASWPVPYQDGISPEVASGDGAEDSIAGLTCALSLGSPLLFRAKARFWQSSAVGVFHSCAAAPGSG